MTSLRNTYFCQAIQDGMETICIVNADNESEVYETLDRNWFTIDKKSWTLHLVDRTLPHLTVNRRKI